MYITRSLSGYRHFINYMMDDHSIKSLKVHDLSQVQIVGDLGIAVPFTVQEILRKPHNFPEALLTEARALALLIEVSSFLGLLRTQS